MKIYLDDERKTPKGWIRVFWPDEAIKLKKEKGIIKSMPRNFVHKLYDNWMKKNIHRFHQKPFISAKRKWGYHFKFNGITSSIKGHINKYGLSIAVEYENEVYDLIFDIDIIPTRSIDGYYCKLCDDAFINGDREDKPSIYPSKANLWEEHTLEPFLDWSNTFLIQSNCLCLSGNLHKGWTSAIIKNKEKAHNGNYDFIIPVKLN
ncbi:MAG: hypothetical protein HQL46_15455 [Gammaproteobacteria bacterium]|nr:hypothetical protein [Gammaproteobacteria bacterium]